MLWAGVLRGPFVSLSPPASSPYIPIRAYAHQASHTAVQSHHSRAAAARRKPLAVTPAGASATA